MSAPYGRQLAELIEYCHIRMRDLLASVEMEHREERVTLAAEQWQAVGAKAQPTAARTIIVFR